MVNLDLQWRGWTRAMIPEADGDFSNAPNFNFNDSKVKFDTNWISNANDNYGSASGFVSKSLLNDGGMPAGIAGILLIFP